MGRVTLMRPIKTFSRHDFLPVVLLGVATRVLRALVLSVSMHESWLSFRVRSVSAPWRKWEFSARTGGAHWEPTGFC